MPQAITQNTLFYGDNLDILREDVPDESVHSRCLESKGSRCS